MRRSAREQAHLSYQLEGQHTTLQESSHLLQQNIYSQLLIDSDPTRMKRQLRR